MNDFVGPVEELPAKEDNLIGHCEAIGRDEQTVERTFGFGTTFIRDTRREAFALMADVFVHNGNAKVWTGTPVGTVDDVVEFRKPHLDGDSTPTDLARRWNGREHG
jgi:hypothetical protein